MKRAIFFILLMFGFAFVVLAEDNPEYYARMKRIKKQCDEEIVRRHELKKLELQYRIYCKEIELRRNNQYNISISSPQMRQAADIDIRNMLNQRMKTVDLAK